MRILGVINIIAVVIMLLVVPVMVIGQEGPTHEVDYPPIDGQTPGPGPAEWVNYIFLFALALVGFVAMASLIYAGIIWMTSTSEGKIKDAKDRVLKAILGIVLVAASVVLLETINPDLINLTNPTVRQEVFDPGEVEFDEGDENGDDEEDCSPPSVYDPPSDSCRLPDGQLCVNNNECLTGSYCNAILGVCARQRPPNAPCDPDAGPGQCSGDLQCIRTTPPDPEPYRCQSASGADQ